MTSSQETRPSAGRGYQAVTFMGLAFETNGEALAPRPETELLAQCAMQLLRKLMGARRNLRVLDLCTGSGNLALTLASYEPLCEVCAADISGSALAVARHNAARLNLETRIRFFEGDLFAAVSADAENGFDLIVCNPPYISSSKVDKMLPQLGCLGPREAFDGGPFGLNILIRLIEEAPAHLKPSSWLCFEVGQRQGDFLARSLQRHGAYAEVQRITDETGEVRALAACSTPGALLGVPCHEQNTLAR